MGRPLGDKIPEKTSILFTPINLRDIETSIKSGEFKTITDLVNHCIRFYFDSHNRIPGPVRDDFLRWMVSEEGKKYLKDLIREVEEEERK